MYNRYIPQADGSHQRSRVPDPAPEVYQSIPTADPCPPPPKIQPPPPCSHSNSAGKEGILSFFRQLLPRNMNTGDLMVILLLLLIAGDCEENRNHALLTLALYFFL